MTGICPQAMEISQKCKLIVNFIFSQHIVDVVIRITEAKKSDLQ